MRPSEVARAPLCSLSHKHRPGLRTKCTYTVAGRATAMAGSTSFGKRNRELNKRRIGSSIKRLRETRVGIQTWELPLAFH